MKFNLSFPSSDELTSSEDVLRARNDPRWRPADQFELVPDAPGRTVYVREKGTGREYVVHRGESEHNLTSIENQVVLTPNAQTVIRLEPISTTSESRQLDLERTRKQWETERRRKHAATAASARPVDAAEAAGAPQPITVREAARIIRNAAGRIEADGTGLVVSIPPAAEGRRRLLWAAAVLYAAADTVTKAAKADKLDNLPDQPVTPSGHLV